MFAATVVGVSFTNRGGAYYGNHLLAITIVAGLERIVFVSTGTGSALKLLSGHFRADVSK
jgi:hypothetical protein